ncbi:unnamed protein product [Symbiodinium sp. CCMP2592]|nr:unnamed protein product [Symbiodinium sp. CCMP2592]
MGQLVMLLYGSLGASSFPAQAGAVVLQGMMSPLHPRGFSVGLSGHGLGKQVKQPPLLDDVPAATPSAIWADPSADCDCVSHQIELAVASTAPRQWNVGRIAGSMVQQVRWPQSTEGFMTSKAAFVSKKVSVQHPPPSSKIAVSAPVTGALS